jgi:indolepyruvate ferredoxin oxidoreductase
MSAVSLNDKYELESGRVYLTGTQALVRLVLIQRRRDIAAGLNTGGFVSGYRGSPMTAIDQQLWRASKQLDEHHIKFWPGTNEDLAATAVWGSQQTQHFNDSNYDGVFSFWYGKGPGVDRSLDPIRQGHWHGSSKHGGVLILSGDDPNMTSTISAWHSELLFEDLLMPVLYPADIQEVFDMGLMGIAMSRFSGNWIGYKLLPETIETAASINAAHDDLNIIVPDFDFPADGVNARQKDSWTLQESRLRHYRLPAALAFARANSLNYVSHSSNRARFGIAAMGKTWRDVQQALLDIGIDEGMAASLGITVLKVAMPFPVDTDTYRDFAKGLEEVLVIEDKREQIENGLRQACYALSETDRPRVVGRYDEQGDLLVDTVGELTADTIARIIARRIEYFHSNERVKARIAFLDKQLEANAKRETSKLSRLPYFCSGCPHNSSTKVPEGSRAAGGVGCHFMANWMDREVYSYTQMGGEGTQWIGQQPFVKTKHIFQQLGDGTYYHSGTLAIRAAVAAGINITYKILYNDAVAMTGGQPVDGQLTVWQISQQVRNEGVVRIAVVSDDPEKYTKRSDFATDTSFHHRRDLDAVQRELREVAGCSVLIYDQTCAAEKRRRRKRGKFPDPAKRLFINDRVCEGCGDCGLASNCVSVQPIDTEYGRKRMIDQSSCNKDYSCVNGFCPSFVTVLGGKVRKSEGLAHVPDALQSIPEPKLPSLDTNNYGILVTGVGGTGVVTIGALLGTAAHIDDRGIVVVDQMGFAQKGGPVMTHLRIAATAENINAVRLNAGAADLLLGCDLVVSAGDKALSVLDSNKTRAIVNSHETITGDFTRNADMRYPNESLQQRLKELLGPENLEMIESTRLATRLLGDAIASNLFLVGYAWQKGLLPLTEKAILQAVELNGVAVEWNQEAFRWGRRAAHNFDAVADLCKNSNTKATDFENESLDELVQRRSNDLRRYQDDSYASRYASLVNTVKEAEQKQTPGHTELSNSVARYAYKLMAYKDEYEVARLYSEPVFKQKLGEQFEGSYKLRFNLAPPLLARKDKVTGKPRKMEFGSWLFPMFGLLSKLKFLRGTAIDPFGWTAERKMERGLIVKYEETIKEILQILSDDNHALAVEIANLPDQIRGYGYIKEENVIKTHTKLQSLLECWRNPAKISEAEAA